jgi:hypothetical protein
MLIAATDPNYSLAAVLFEVEGKISVDTAPDRFIMILIR